MRYVTVVCLALLVAVPATGQMVWEQKADCPHPTGYGTAIAFAPNVGKLYAMRELQYQMYEDLDYYYPPADAWGSVYNGTAYDWGTGYGASLAYCPDGNVYFVSGGNQRFSGGIETSLDTIFAPALGTDNTWPAATYKGTGITCHESDSTLIYVTTGATPENDPQGYGSWPQDPSMTWLMTYDFRAGTWDVKAPFPEDQMTGGAIVYGYFYYYCLIGNETSHFYGYDPASDSWTQLADAPGPVGPGGSLVYDGGLDILALQGGGTPNVWSYAIDLDQWTVQTPLPEPVGAYDAYGGGEGNLLAWDPVGMTVYAMVGAGSHSLYASSWLPRPRPDTKAPTISHTPLSWQFYDFPEFTVSAGITDDTGVAGGADGPKVYHRVGGGGYTAVDMTETEPGVYQASLPTQPQGTTVEYYLWAKDTADPPNEETLPAGNPPSTPFSFNVLPTADILLMSEESGPDTSAFWQAIRQGLQGGTGPFPVDEHYLGDGYPELWQLEYWPTVLWFDKGWLSNAYDGDPEYTYSAFDSLAIWLEAGGNLLAWIPHFAGDLGSSQQAGEARLYEDFQIDYMGSSPSSWSAAATDTFTSVVGVAGDTLGDPYAGGLEFVQELSRGDAINQATSLATTFLTYASDNPAGIADGGAGTWFDAGAYKAVWAGFDYAALEDGAAAGQLLRNVLTWFGHAPHAAEDVTARPGVVSLGAPWPNPACGRLNLAVHMPEAGTARVHLYNLLGHRVATLFSGRLAAGDQSMSLRITEHDMPSGVYYLTLDTPAGSLTRRLVLTR
jgi:hypothetical protein